ncbi:PREDICTED: DNA ligase 1-like [Branchiostoma belcheri]|uniref:DNA ligase 1-like n=1 Tax=Branchiostoma belcheri TaxID=7741 RepID=A0A6P5AAK8_BRABE|nr:PREDICTED: DNA ligase 1-like [Branchiostoma belcheri]
MDEQDKKKLVRNRVAIVESLIVEDVRAFLIEREVFTSDQFQQITRQTTRRHKAEELLDLLPTRGPKAFQEFRKALKQCNYSFLDSLLEKGGLEGKPQHTERQKTIPESLLNSLKSLTEENAKLKAELKTLRAENAQKQKNIDNLKRQNDSRVLKEHVQNEKTKKVQEELKTYKEKVRIMSSVTTDKLLRDLEKERKQKETLQREKEEMSKKLRDICRGYEGLRKKVEECKKNHGRKIIHLGSNKLVVQNPEKPQVIKGTGVVTSSMKDGVKAARGLQRTQTMFTVGSPGQVSPDSTRCNTAPGRGQKPESKPVTKTIIVPSWNEVSKENKAVSHSTKPVVRVGGTSTVSPKGSNTSSHPPTFARGATEETSPRQVRSRATLKSTMTTPTQVGKDKTQKQETGHNKLSTTPPAGQQFSATRLSPHRPPTGSSGYRSESRSTTRTHDTDDISEDTRSRTSERQGLLSRRDKASPNRVSTGRSSSSSGRHSTTKVKIKVPSPDLRGPISIEYEIANESQSVDSDSTES